MKEAPKVLTLLFESRPTHPSDIEGGARLRILGTIEEKAVRFLEIEETSPPRRIFFQLSPQLASNIADCCGTPATEQPNDGLQQALKPWLSICRANRGDPYEDGLQFSIATWRGSRYCLICFVPEWQIETLAAALR